MIKRLLIGTAIGAVSTTFASAAFAEATAEAVAALAAVSLADAQASLGTLEQASLITETSPGRYQLHDLVKLHAAHMAESVEEQAQRNAALAGLFEFYLDTAASAGKGRASSSSSCVAFIVRSPSERCRPSSPGSTHPRPSWFRGRARGA